MKHEPFGNAKRRGEGQSRRKRMRFVLFASVINSHGIMNRREGEFERSRRIYPVIPGIYDTFRLELHG